MILLLCKFKSIPSVAHREFSCWRSLSVSAATWPSLTSTEQTSTHEALMRSWSFFWGLIQKHRKDLLSPAVSSLKRKKEWESFKQEQQGKVGVLVQGTGFHLDKCSCLTSTTRCWWATWCHAEIWEGLPMPVQLPMCGEGALGFFSPDPSFSVPYTLHLGYRVFAYFWSETWGVNKVKILSQ